MNCILLSDYYYPSIKSGAIIMRDLALELLLQGHYVTILTFVESQDDIFFDSIENGIRVIRIHVPTRKYGRLGRFWAEKSYSSKIIIPPELTIGYKDSKEALVPS